MWRQVVLQTPQGERTLRPEHPYAQAAVQLNRLLRQGHSFSGHERNCCFLNLQNGQYATASGVSGFDQADDGRAIAKCDWDFDGDLDFWVANRTAPQIRFMRNEIGSKKHFLAFRLIGTESNHDAIGARVRIRVAANGSPLVQSVRAGEGFLAQSSKVVHFGLGDSKEVTEVSVRWPNGVEERFATPSGTDAYYDLVEGSARPVPWTPPRSPGFEPVAAPRAMQLLLETHNLLTERIPLPPLHYETENGQRQDVTRATGHPVLVNLWATWCPPCLKELAEWSRDSDQFTAAGAHVVALSVDAVSAAAKEGDQPAAKDVRETVEKTLDNLKYPFDRGYATEEFVELLQQVHNVLYDHHRSLPVPTSLLLDADGRLAAIYKGPLSTQRVVSDIKRTMAGQSPADSALPFPGRWVSRPGTHNISKLVTRLWDGGFGDHAVVLTDRLGDDSRRTQQVRSRLVNAIRLRSRGDVEPARLQLYSALKLDADDVDTNMEMGLLCAAEGQLESAVRYLAQAVAKSDTPRADLHANLGAALRQLGNTADAEKHLRAAIRVEPNTVEAHSNLGLLLAAQRRFEKAAASFRVAAEGDPTNTNRRINLAMALSNAGNVKEAISEIQQVLQHDPDSLTARIYLGEFLAQNGRLENAIEQFREVTIRQPKASRMWLRLAQVAEQHGDHALALNAYQTVDSLAPDDPRIAIRIAWLLATADDAELRDGETAVKMAEAIRRTSTGSAMVLDVLAAAYAEVGRFDDAVRTASEAADLLDPTADGELLRQVRTRQRDYEQNKPYRSTSRLE